MSIARNHRFRFAILSAAAAIAFMAAIPSAKAGNTTLLTDKNGQITFPISPPNRATNGPGAIDNMAIGATRPSTGRFTQIQTDGVQPSIASGACGAAANGSVVAGSTPGSGQINIGAAATTACAVTFNPPLPQAPRACTFSPANAGASNGGTTGAYVSAVSASGFTITGTALASANYSYHCL